MIHLPTTATATPWWDGSAIGLSGLCLVHCLALPVLAALAPALSAAAEAEWVHLAVLLTAAPVSAFALVQSGGWRSPGLAGAARAGLALLLAGVAGWPSHEAETTTTVLGSLALATAHVINWRRNRRRGCAG